MGVFFHAGYLNADRVKGKHFIKCPIMSTKDNTWRLKMKKKMRLCSVNIRLNVLMSLMTLKSLVSV